jgi:hypothetical protein
MSLHPSRSITRMCGQDKIDSYTFQQSFASQPYDRTTQRCQSGLAKSKLARCIHQIDQLRGICLL